MITAYRRWRRMRFCTQTRLLSSDFVSLSGGWSVEVIDWRHG